MNQNEMPNISELAKLYYATSRTGARTQICLTEEIPQLEEAPEQITGSAVDIDYEFSRPGKVKASQVEVPVFYTHTQHKRLKQIEKQNLYFFLEYPQSTVEGLTGETPLIKMFQGSLVLIGDTMSDNEWIKDIVSIYKTSAVEEMYTYPSVSI